MNLKKLFAIIIVLLTVANLYFTNRLTGTGKRVIQLTQDIHALRHQNRQLSIKIAKKRSLANLEEKIKKAGFSEPKEVVTLAPTDQVAFNE